MNNSIKAAKLNYLREMKDENFSNTIWKCLSGIENSTISVEVKINESWNNIKHDKKNKQLSTSMNSSLMYTQEISSLKIRPNSRQMNAKWKHWYWN